MPVSFLHLSGLWIPSLEELDERRVSSDEGEVRRHEDPAVREADARANGVAEPLAIVSYRRHDVLDTADGVRKVEE